MAKLRKPYTNLTDVVNLVLLQARDSIKDVPQFINPPGTPENLFYQLKGLIKYKADPINIEYIQSIKTLFLKNGGRGDCDCFTVLSLAALEYYFPNYNKYIVLVGYSKKSARHIYAAYSDDKEYYVFDLTNPFFDMERTKYKYRQILDVTKLL